MDGILGDGWDVVVDGADNFPTRYLLNDASVWHGVPVVHGSIFRFEGQVTVFAPKLGPCYRCLFPQPPPPELAPSCAEGGVLGVLPGVIGSIQATETLKLVLGIGEPLIGRLLLYDALAGIFDEVAVRRDPACPVCGDAPTITEYVDYVEFCDRPGLSSGASWSATRPRRFRTKPAASSCCATAARSATNAAETPRPRPIGSGSRSSPRSGSSRTRATSSPSSTPTPPRRPGRRAPTSSGPGSGPRGPG